MGKILLEPKTMKMWLPLKNPKMTVAELYRDWYSIRGSPGSVGGGEVR